MLMNVLSFLNLMVKHVGKPELFSMNEPVLELKLKMKKKR